MKRLILCSTVNDDMSSRKDQREENFTQVTAKTKAQLNIYVMVVITIYQFICKKKRKVLPKPQGRKEQHYLCFCSPLPDTSLHCETTDKVRFICITT